MRSPEWTVRGYRQCGDYIATCAYFFSTKREADDKERELREGRWVVVKRPWNREADLPKMSAHDRQEITRDGP